MHIQLNKRRVGQGEPAYIIAEMSANHGQSFDEAVRIVHAAKDSGADAIKLQTYRPDTITIDCNSECFRIGSGTIWEGQNLYELYGQAFTPWEWHHELSQLAKDLELDFFSTPFDDTAVDFLSELNVPAFKVASFEIVDLPLLRRIAAAGKPVIMSTGMASLAEISEAVETLRDGGISELALLKCTSAYPSPPEAINLQTIPHLSQTFHVPAGLSDHTMGIAVPIAAISLGASIIEKHFTLSRHVEGPDSSFSLEPHEFKAMVEAVRTAEKAVGTVSYGIGKTEAASRVFRRSLFVVKDVKQGERFSTSNVRSIRPGHGLPPKHLPDILGRHAVQNIPRGTPLCWHDVA